MSWKDLPEFPQDIPEIPAMGTPDEIDEMWYNAEHSYPAITIKPFTGKNEPPLRPMQRQHLPLGHSDRIPYEERMYQFFRNYRLDVERGRIACSDEEYDIAYIHEEIYRAIWFGHLKVDNNDCGYVDVEITRKNWKHVWEYYVGSNKEVKTRAWLLLLKDRRRYKDRFNPVKIPEENAELAKSLGMSFPYDDEDYAEYVKAVEASNARYYAEHPEITVTYYGGKKS
ncbi:MAG: hypothetical protein IJQ24_07025 [Synergistaceae bacterium]|nr:hypothetical protein [Synergistaceae bacterium]